MHRMTVLHRTQYQVQITTIEAIDDLAAGLLQHRPFRSHVPGSAQRPLVGAETDWHGVTGGLVLADTLRRSEVFGAGVAHIGLRGDLIEIAGGSLHTLGTHVGEP